MREERRNLMPLNVRDAILKASLGTPPRGTSPSDARIWRWFPWLMSYAGMRPAEVLSSKGQDFLEPWIFNGQTVQCLRRRDAKPNQAWAAPLHPALVDMGLIEMASAHKETYPFLPGDASEKATIAALKRYRRRLENSGLLLDYEGMIFTGFRVRFAHQLNTVNTPAPIRDLLMGRRMEPSKFDDGSGAFLAGASAVSKLEIPKFT